MATFILKLLFIKRLVIRSSLQRARTKVNTVPTGSSAGGVRSTRTTLRRAVLRHVASAEAQVAVPPMLSLLTTDQVKMHLV